MTECPSTRSACPGQHPHRCGRIGSLRALFERESELAAVDEALSELCGLSRDGAEPLDRPRGALIAFAGRAGLGKTSLLAEARRRAAAKGCTVASARGGDQEQRVAFQVVRQLVQPLPASVPDAELRDVLGSWYAIVGQRAPLVVVIDDAHWADAESLSWLSAFAPRAEALPLLLVVAYRPEELPTWCARPRPACAPVRCTAPRRTR